MAESNPTQVILTDDGIKIIEAQSSADNATSGVTDLNNPNLMSVIEKQNNVSQFAGLTSQYNVIVQNAKDEGIDTTAVTVAYNNLNHFMTDILADPNHASDVNRVTYKKYQDAYNEELSNLQNALQNNANNKFASAASASSEAATMASQATSAADNAFNRAQTIGSQASSAIAVQSTATAKAQSAADNAFSRAVTAIDNGKVTSQAVTDLKDGSTLTIAQLGNGLASKVANSDFTSYKTQTASLIGSKVANSDFSTYKTQTDKLIGSKVDNGTYQSDKTQTANMIASKVSSVDFNNLTISNRNLVLGTATAFKKTGNGSTNNVGYMYHLSKTIAKGTTITIAYDITSTSATGNFTTQLVGGSWQGSDMLSLTAGTQHYSYTRTTGSDYSDGVQIRLDNSTSTVTVSNFIISESSKEVSWTPAPEDQATKSQITQLSGEIDQKVDSGDFSSYKTQTDKLIGSKVSSDGFESYKTQTAKNINLRVATKDLIDQINIQAGNTLISSSGQLTLSGKTIYFDSTNPVIIPSANIDKLLVDKKLTAADISANTFTTNNGTFTVDSSGAITAKNMTIVDGTLTSPTINGSTINTPNLNMGDNGQIIGNYSVNDDTGWFQPINGTGTLQISNGYIRSTANIVYYNKILSGIGGDKWGHWASSTQFVPAPDQTHPDTGNIAESTFTPAFLKLDIFEADKSKVNSRTYIDGTGLYINDGGTQAISAMLTDYELVSSGMAYLNSGIQMKQAATFTFGNLAMNGYHSISMLDGNALNFTDNPHARANPIEITAKTFTKASRLSIKHDITPLSTAESSRLLNAIDIEKFRYTHDGATYKYQYGGVIDDVNSLGSKQYSMPPELLSEDGTGINLDSLTGILVKRVQDQDKTIAELSMRLTKLEMEK